MCRHGPINEGPETSLERAFATTSCTDAFVVVSSRTWITTLVPEGEIMRGGSKRGAHHSQGPIVSIPPKRGLLITTASRGRKHAPREIPQQTMGQCSVWGTKHCPMVSCGISSGACGTPDARLLVS